MLDLADVDAPEQAERAEPAAALEQVAQAERRTWPEQDLAADHFLGRAAVADDDQVIDERLGAFADGDVERHPGAILRQRRRELDFGGGESEVEILQLHSVARRR